MGGWTASPTKTIHGHHFGPELLCEWCGWRHPLNHDLERWPKCDRRLKALPVPTPPPPKPKPVVVAPKPTPPPKPRTKPGPKPGPRTRCNSGLHLWIDVYRYPSGQEECRLCRKDRERARRIRIQEARAKAIAAREAWCTS